MQPTPEQRSASKRSLIIVGSVVAGIIFLCCSGSLIATSLSNHGAQATATVGVQQQVHKTATKAPAAPTATAKPKPTAVPKTWHTVATFTGNGDQQTPDFTVPNDNWRMVWSCDPNSFYGDSYNLAVDVDPVDQTQLGDPGAINTICGAGNSTGTTNIHDLSGKLYLSILSEAAWTIKVQVFE